jgi:hypothetical protein
VRLAEIDCVLSSSHIGVQNMGNLERALDVYFQPELLDGDNAYECEAVGRRVPAIKRTLIETLPHTFAIHLKRFEYDIFHLTRVKILDRFEFPSKLDMFKYTPEGAAATTDEGRAGAAEKRGASVGRVPHNYYVYELKGVIVHAGNAFAGHYYSFVKERGHQGRGHWQCFDDTTVTSWDPSNMVECCFGGPAGGDGPMRSNSAFMLFYERKDEFEPINICPHLQQPPTAVAAVGSEADAASPVDADPPAAANGHYQESRTTSHPLPDPQSSDSYSSASSAGEVQADVPMVTPGNTGAVPYGMPQRLYAQIMQENLWLAQACHLTAPCHTVFLRDLLIECLKLQTSSDCHDVRHTMAAGGAIAGKTLSCDARTATALKRLAVISDGVPQPAAILPEGSDAAGSHEALAVLLSLKYLLSTLVYITVDDRMFKFFVDSVESGLERQLAVETSLVALHESLRWQATAPVCPLNGLLHPDGRVREMMNQVVMAVLFRVFAGMDVAPVAKAVQHPGTAPQLVRS